MARLWVVTGVLLAAAAARLGAPCAAVKSCPCLVEATDDVGAAVRHLDALPAVAPEPSVVRDTAAAPPSHDPPAVLTAVLDVLAVAPKTSPPALVA